MKSILDQLRMYAVRYVCMNCSKGFTKSVPQGTEAPYGAECPHCRCFTGKRSLSLTK